MLRDHSDPAPSPASHPNPADGATEVGLHIKLRWTAGIGVDSHDVYFGTNPAPGAAEFKGNQATTIYDPGTLDPNMTYYWRIDEISEDYGTKEGTVWSFTTGSGSGSSYNPFSTALSQKKDLAFGSL